MHCLTTQGIRPVVVTLGPGQPSMQGKGSGTLLHRAWQEAHCWSVVIWEGHGEGLNDRPRTSASCCWLRHRVWGWVHPAAGNAGLLAMQKAQLTAQHPLWAQRGVPSLSSAADQAGWLPLSTQGPHRHVQGIGLRGQDQGAVREMRAREHCSRPRSCTNLQAPPSPAETYTPQPYASGPLALSPAKPSTLDPKPQTLNPMQVQPQPCGPGGWRAGSWRSGTLKPEPHANAPPYLAGPGVGGGAAGGARPAAGG